LPPTGRDFYEVIVVGAGPAGASAAYALAKQGIRVALLEKASMPRYKPCGAGLVPRAIQSLPFDVSEVVEHRCYIAELNLVDAGMGFTVTRKFPMVSMTMREDFDFLLYRKAAEAGADVRDECRVEGVESHGRRVDVQTSQGKISGRFMVASDGALGLVARMAGWKETRTLVPLLEWEVFVPQTVFDRFSGRARFDFGYFPSGYAWIFPKKDHLSIGLGGKKPVPGGLREALERYIKESGIDRIDRIEKHGYVIPLSSRRDSMVRGRVILTGDSAGFVDSVTAEGITFAIRSGQLAARAIVEGRFEEQEVRKRYGYLLRDVRDELRWGRPLQKLLYGPAAVRNFFFHLYGQRLSEAVADVLSGTRSYKRLILSPSSYLSLLKLRKEQKAGVNR
jgi:geranylgeranyl reductase family protein